VYAPEGRYIVGVSWVNSNAPSPTNNVSCGLDDFAFITSNKSFVIPKNDVLYGDDIVETNELISATNTVDSIVVDPDSSGGDSSILFGSDKPNQGISSTNAPVDQSSSDTDYSVLFGSDRPGGGSSSSSTNRDNSVSEDDENDAATSDGSLEDDYSSLFGSDRPGG
jgi:hypothetical protein